MAPRPDETTPPNARGAPAAADTSTPPSGPSRTPSGAAPGRSSGAFPSAGSRRFGKYQLLTELGRGGMATVYLAVAHSGIQDVRRLVVVKLLDDNLRTDAEFVKMFARESKIAIELSHPNVVLTHTVGQEEGRYYIAMEYLEGVTLREIMKYCGDWPLQDRLPLFGAMCLMLTGLGYVHDFQDHRGEHLGLVHRDIKPDNIFITTTGQVKLLDFGVAKAASAGFEATLGAAVRGTVQYLPPEATKADEVVDHRWDLFSSAVILAELTTGRRYWEEVPYPQIFGRLVADELPTLKPSADEDIPPPLVRMLERALQPEPVARYQSATELRKAVLGVLARQGYRVNSSDLARIVAHLYEPIRQQREEVIRAGLEEVDRARPPAGTWSVGATAGQHVPTPASGDRSEDTTPAILPDESMAAPSRTRWYVPAALLALLVLLPIGWMLRPDGDTTPTPAAAPPPVREAPAAPVVVDEPPPQPAPKVEAPSSPPVPPPVIEATPEVPAASVEVEVASEAEVPPSSTSKSRRGRSRKHKDTPADTSASKADDPPKPASSGKKLELEPSPYTR